MTMPIPPSYDDDELPPGFPETWERNWAVFCHLGGFAGLVLPGLGHVLVPLVLWLLRRDRSAFVDDHGREALNFQISITLYAIVATALMWVLIGFLLIVVVVGVQLVFMVLASVAASHGERYRYPLTLRLVS
ncbi:MAG: DUF4870 domain-containing protein [Deltaproteobacteria bacterium]|nr:DUF4870 domain-containing protein [Deltaproteobacteria bacterium]